jgi:hypothetical protein
MKNDMTPLCSPRPSNLFIMWPCICFWGPLCDLSSALLLYEFPHVQNLPRILQFVLRSVTGLVRRPHIDLSMELRTSFLHRCTSSMQSLLLQLTIVSLARPPGSPISVHICVLVVFALVICTSSLLRSLLQHLLHPAISTQSLWYHLLGLKRPQRSHRETNKYA